MSNEVTTNNNVAKDNKEKKPGFFKKMAKFFKDMKSEAKKVVWPNKKQVINNTAVAIAAIVLVGVLVGGLDAVFSWLRNLLISVL
ncbi:MAG: preprotein translocase subunit SecE [Clostridia bacterium]|nr:preprotein translocase subunit SecE [Clostridia bacterium]MBQ6868142.1 preprotein translocase subunit SecE [Clostridia bacterium]